MNLPLLNKGTLQLSRVTVTSKTYVLLRLMMTVGVNLPVVAQRALSSYTTTVVVHFPTRARVTLSFTVVEILKGVMLDLPSPFYFRLRTKS